MTTASQIMQRAWRKLGQMEQFVANGGSTSTATTNTLTGKYRDNDFDGGSVVVIRDAGGASAAPEGEIQAISSYADSGTTQTFTVGTVFSAAVASGDTIGYVKGLYPKETMLSLLNDALVGLGRVPYVDTSLTTAADQTMYTLPVLLKETDIYDIQIEGDTADADDAKYTHAAYWEVLPAAANTTTTLVLPQYIADKTIKIIYARTHPELTAVSSYISEYIHPELIVSALLVEAYGWQVAKRDQSAEGKMITRMLDRWEVKLANAKIMYPIWMPVRRHKYLVPGDTTRKDA